MPKDLKCYRCAYRRDFQGSACIRCVYDWTKSEYVPPQGEVHGIRNGWWRFPLNYDPVWMIDECPAFSGTADPNMTREDFHPLLEILALLK